MSMVRFATLCDHCQRRSDEYASWPTCRDCGEDVCEDCDLPAERTEDERNETLCRKCGQSRIEEEESADDARYEVADNKYDQEVEDQVQ